MSEPLEDLPGGMKRPRKHPPAERLEDVITFRINQLVWIGERAGHHWSERLFDLSLNEWRLLAMIRSRSPCRAGDLADLLMMDKSQTSRVIKSLLKKQLVLNMPDPHDGRAIALKPTKKGDALFAKMFEEVLQSNERILSVLNAEEIEVFEGILKKLVEHSQDLLEARLGRKLVR